MRTVIETNYVNEWFNNILVTSGGATNDGGQAINLFGGNHVSGVNFVLANGGHVRGMVRDPSGSLIEGITVVAYTGGGIIASVTSTDSNGAYAFNPMLGGNYYVRTFEDGYLDEWWQNKDVLSGNPVSDNAALVTVAVGGTVNGIDLQLDGAADISGQVLDEFNNQVGGINILLFDLQSNFVSSATTIANGSYTLNDVPLGSYYARTDGGGANVYVHQWYDSRPVQSGRPG